jgi:hypothetical protein
MIYSRFFFDKNGIVIDNQPTNRTQTTRSLMGKINSVLTDLIRYVVEMKRRQPQQSAETYKTKDKLGNWQCFSHRRCFVGGY